MSYQYVILDLVSGTTPKLLYDPQFYELFKDPYQHCIKKPNKKPPDNNKQQQQTSIQGNSFISYSLFSISLS